MSKSKAVVTLAAVAAIASVATVQADGGGSGQLASISPPPIREPFSANPLPCIQGDSTVAVKGCIEHRVLKSDAEIDKLNRAIAAELASASQKRKFVVAHRAWLAYRNADCDSMSSIFEGGTFLPVAHGDCLQSRNEQRIRDLRQFRRAPE